MKTKLSLGLDRGINTGLVEVIANSNGAMTFQATTTAPNQTVTLQRITPTGGSCTVTWGDGQTSTIADGNTGTTTHQYASAGTYNVSVSNPSLITCIDLHENTLTVSSSGIKLCVNVATCNLYSLKGGRFDSAEVSAWRPTDFRLFSMPAGYAGTFNTADVSAWRPTTFQLFSMPSGYAGTFNTADVSAWRPTDFRLYSMPSGYAGTFNTANVSAWRPTTFQLYLMPAGYAGTFNTADVSAWRPTTFQLLSMPAGYAGTFNSSDVSAWRPTTFTLFSMPAGYAGTFNSADVSAWRPTTFQLYSMPVATFTITIASGGFAGWVSTTTFQMQGNSLLQAAVNQILADHWAAFATRTAAAGTINVGGTNAAPSGTYQAANPPTTGKEYAYELLNDSQNVNPTKKWATVTFTA